MRTKSRARVAADRAKSAQQGKRLTKFRHKDGVIFPPGTAYDKMVTFTLHPKLYFDRVKQAPTIRLATPGEVSDLTSVERSQYEAALAGTRSQEEVIEVCRRFGRLAS